MYLFNLQKKKKKRKKVRSRGVLLNADNQTTTTKAEGEHLSQDCDIVFLRTVAQICAFKMFYNEELDSSA